MWGVFRKHNVLLFQAFLIPNIANRHPEQMFAHPWWTKKIERKRKNLSWQRRKKNCVFSFICFTNEMTRWPVIPVWLALERSKQWAMGHWKLVQNLWLLVWFYFFSGWYLTTDNKKQCKKMLDCCKKETCAKSLAWTFRRTCSFQPLTGLFESASCPEFILLLHNANGCLYQSSCNFGKRTFGCLDVCSTTAVLYFLWAMPHQVSIQFRILFRFLVFTIFNQYNRTQRRHGCLVTCSVPCMQGALSVWLVTSGLKKDFQMHFSFWWWWVFNRHFVFSENVTKEEETWTGTCTICFPSLLVTVESHTNNVLKVKWTGAVHTRSPSNGTKAVTLSLHRLLHFPGLQLSDPSDRAVGHVRISGHWIAFYELGSLQGPGNFLNRNKMAQVTHVKVRNNTQRRFLGLRYRHAHSGYLSHLFSKFVAQHSTFLPRHLTTLSFWNRQSTKSQTWWHFVQFQLHVVQFSLWRGGGQKVSSTWELLNTKNQSQNGETKTLSQTSSGTCHATLTLELCSTCHGVCVLKHHRRKKAFLASIPPACCFVSSGAKIWQTWHAKRNCSWQEELHAEQPTQLERLAT